MEPDVQIEAINVIENRINNIISCFQKSFIPEKIETFKDELANQLRANNADRSASGGVTDTMEKINIDHKEEQGKRYEKIISSVEELSSQLGMDPALIKTMIAVESNFDPDAVSSAGAMGLMQLMPSTADYLGVQNPFDIYQNLKGGITYLKSLTDRFGDDLKLALAAYNSGPSKVEKYGDVPPIEETQNYVNKILASYDPELL